MNNMKNINNILRAKSEMSKAFKESL